MENVIAEPWFCLNYFGKVDKYDKMSEKQLIKVVDKESALLHATLDLLIENGFHDAPMSKIAKRAGVSVGTVYIYFGSKQDLVNKLYLNIKSDFATKIFAGYSKKKSVEDAFKTIWYNIARYKFNFYKEARFLSLCDNAPIIGDDVRQRGLENLNPLLALWEKGMREGIIKKLSPYLLYAYSMYPLNFLIYMDKIGEFKVDDEQIDNAFAITWQGIKNK